MGKIIFITFLFSGNLAFSGNINFNEMIDASNKEAQSYRQNLGGEKLDTSKPRGKVKFEADEAATVAVQSNVNLNHNQESEDAKLKSKKKKMILEVDKLEDEVATVPEE